MRKWLGKMGSILLALIVVINVGGYARANGNPEGSAGEYWDIVDHWARFEVERLVEENIVDGIEVDGIKLIKPDELMTRGEFTKLVVNGLFSTEELMNTISGVDSELLFSDIEGHWAEDYIVFASILGIVNGYSDGSFRPNDTITRAEAIKILVVSNELFDNYCNGNLENFNDVNQDYWAYNYIAKAYESELVLGYDDSTLRPDNYIQRAEAMVFLDRYIDFSSKEVFVRNLREASVIADSANTYIGETIMFSIDDDRLYEGVMRIDGLTYTAEFYDGEQKLGEMTSGYWLYRVSGLLDNDIICRISTVNEEEVVYVSNALAYRKEAISFAPVSSGGSSGQAGSVTEPQNIEPMTRGLSLVMDNFSYIQETGQYVLDDEIAYIDGVLRGYTSPVTVQYAVTDENGFQVKTGTVQGISSFRINDIAFAVGMNTIDIKILGAPHALFIGEVASLDANFLDDLFANNNDSNESLILEVYNFNEDNAVNSDLSTSDYDMDGVSDFFEMYVLYSDPLIADTDSNGTSDGNEDPDNDGLTNAIEESLGTNPFLSDSDNDSLLDGDEVNNFLTNPTLVDTDSDGLDDNVELDLGTNPNNPDSDGDGLLDGQETFMIVKSMPIDETDPDVVPTITMNIPGEIIDTLEIEMIDGNDLFLSEDMPGYVGAGYNFELDGTFDSAILTFTFDTDLLLIPGFDPAIYYCDEVNQEMILLENQVIDLINGTVTVEITHFSRYILLNKTAFEEVWDSEIKQPDDINDQPSSLALVLALDSSGSMTVNDPSYIRLDAAKEFVVKMSDDDEAAIIDFDSSAILLTGLTSDKNELINAINSIDSNGGTDIGAAIDLALDQLDIESDSAKFIILLTDGDGEYDIKYTQRAIDNNVEIYTIGLGDAVNENLLKTIASDTGGKYYHATSADELGDIYEDTAEETIDYVTDSDDDGITDYYENLINQGQIRTYTGRTVHVDANNRDTDGDGLADGEEVYININSQGYVYMVIKSSPDMIDTDYDGIPDDDDNLPSDNLFSVVMTTNEASSNVAYTFDLREFFTDNQQFNSMICTVSSIWATAVYHDATIDDRDLIGVMNLHGFEDRQSIILADEYNDNHLSEIAIGHQRVDFNNETKEIISIAVRGTDSSIEEWSSNFNLGNTDDFGTVSDWSDVENHMGFDIAKTRLVEDVLEYISDNVDVNQDEVIIWITGHSRGAAIANLLGAKFEDLQYDTFTYTFATPNTTTSDDAHSNTYSSIFNVVNTDDFVPYLPMWNFTRYGQTASLSIKANYEREWESLTNKFDYNPDTYGLQKTIDSLEAIAIGRNDCYMYRGDNITIRNNGISINSRERAINKIPENALPYCEIEVFDGNILGGWDFTVTQSPQYFMQLIAALMANEISKYRFVVELNIADRYEHAKNRIISSAIGGLEHPHYKESYYLLATHVTANQFD